MFHESNQKVTVTSFYGTQCTWCRRCNSRCRRRWQQRVDWVQPGSEVRLHCWRSHSTTTLSTCRCCTGAPAAAPTCPAIQSPIPTSSHNPSVLLCDPSTEHVALVIMLCLLSVCSSHDSSIRKIRKITESSNRPIVEKNLPMVCKNGNLSYSMCPHTSSTFSRLMTLKLDAA